MKKTIYTLMIILLLGTTFANAQLSVGSSSLNIKSGTIFSTQGLVFTPSADVSMASNTVSFSGTAITNGSDQSIDRVYSFGSPLNSYSGSLGIQYSAGELNGNTESDLQLAYNPLSSGGSFVVTTGSTTGSPGSYYVSNTLSSTDLGKVTALPTPPPLVVDAGGDKTICEDATSYTLEDASQTGYDVVTWTTSGSGTWNSTENTINATYYPAAGDITTGSVTLEVSANTYGSVNPTTDNMTLSFADAPTADAGTDNTICENGTYTTSDASATNYTSVTWTTLGDGSFSNYHSVTQCTYSPGSSDITNGSFSLTLEASNPYCGSVSSTVNVAIQKNPVADAGSDVTICETETHQLNGQVTNADSYEWFRSLGNGNLSSTTVLDPEFTPCTTCGYTDSHEEWFTLSAQPIDPCATAAEDIVKITVWAAPTANAGPDQDVCGSGTILAGSATNNNSVSWSIISGAGGSIDDPTSLTSAFSGSHGVTYTLRLTSGNPACTDATDEVEITFYDNPTVAAAGGDATICSGDNLAANTASGFSETGTWSEVAGDGSGSFGDANSNTSTFSGTAGQSYTLRWTISNGTCPISSDDVDITIKGEPTADAGEDGTVCSDTYELDGSGSGNYDDVEWSIVSGDGNGYFDGTPGTLMSTNLNPTFTGSRGQSYTLRITANPNCAAYDAATDDVTIFLQEEPTANAGAVATTCQDTPYSLDAATATNYESVTWTTTGNGTFEDDGEVNTTYYPAVGDSPSVTLRLTANPVSPCSSGTYDEMVLTIGDAPVVDAGSNASICESGYQLNGEYSHGTASLWTTFGDGTFSNPNILNPFYTPGTADLVSGHVKLSLVVSPISPCTTLKSDDIHLYITQDLPTVYAGADATSCEDTPYNIDDATASDYSSLLWIRLDADGTFDDNTALKPEYTFGPGDKLQGYAKLKLVASPVSPCLLLVEDQITITVQDQVTVNAGIDATICQGDNYHLSYASAGNYSDIGWYTTLGDGTFSNDDVLFPVYTPGTSDILAGSVSLCLVADPISPCSPSIEDCMTLTINPKPEIESATLQMAKPGDVIFWVPVNGSFAAGYDLCIDGDKTSNYILDIDQLSSNNPLAPNVYNEFYINPTEVPAGFYAYWSAQGVNIGAVGSGTWQEAMWYIVNGTNPVFYLLLDAPFKSPPTNYQLIDGFQKQYNSQDVPMVLPGSYPEGDYTFSGTIQDINGCVSDEFDVEMSITHAPYADAGSDATICAGESYSVDDANAGNYASVSWTAEYCRGKGSEPDGSFQNDLTLSPTYTPGPNDIEAGSVCLVLFAEPNSPCSVTAGAMMQLTINPEPDANFCVGEATVGYGDEFEFCYNEDVVVTMCEILQGNGPFDVCWTLDDGEEECLTVNQGDELFNDKLSVGTHIIQLTSITDQNGCELGDPSPYTMTIIVHPEPDANFCVNEATVGYGDEFEFCHGENVNVTMCEILSGTGPFDVCWKLDDGEEECLTVDEGESLFDGTLPDGEHTIELTSITDAKGCVLSDVTPYTMSIEIHPEPALIFAANEEPFYEGAELEYCESETITLTLDEAIAGTGPFDIAWTVNGDTDNAEDVSVGDELFSGTKDPGTYDLLITSITDANGCSPADVSMYNATIVVHPLPEFTSIDLQYAPASETPSYNPVAGNLDEGYQVCLDGMEAEHFFLDVNTLSANVALQQTTMNEFFQTETVPDDFFTYWAGRGVDENASGDWKEIMWNIINGDAPLFYLVYDGSDYALIDGLQYQNTPSEIVPLTIPVDYPAGEYAFTGTVVSADGCTSETITIDMKFVHSPVADAGDDATICENETYTLGGEVTGACDQEWSTSGDGTFDLATSLTAVYTPGEEDIAAGSVELCLTAGACSPCDTDDEDCLTITIQAPPVADAGSDGTICADESFDVYGSVTNACGHSWSTEGDGTFDAANALETTFHPGAEDIAAGTVDLCLSAEACDPCQTADEDCITITINPLPDANFCVNDVVSGYGDEFEVCYDEDVVVTMCEILSGEAPFDVCWTLDNGSEECLSVSEGDELYNNTLSVGTHEIQLTSITDANGCSLADPTPYKMTIIVNPEPDADFCVNDVVSGYGDEFEVCYDEDVKVTMCEILSGEGPFEVCWKLDDGEEECATVNEGDEIYNDLLEVGTHEIQLTSITDADGCKLADATPYKMTIIVNPEPDANFCVNTQTVGYGDEFSFCYDETINVTMCEILAGEGPFDVCWKLDGGTEECMSVDEGESLYNNTLAPGEHTIGLTSITDANGCALADVSAYTMSIEIYPEPAVIFAANGEQFYEGAELEYCEDETITLTLDQAVSGTGPFDIEWTVNGDADSADDVAVGDELFSGTKEPGTYELAITSITDDHGCSVGDVSMYYATIIVHALPELTTVNLQYGEAGDPPSYNPVSGDIENGYNLCIDGNDETHYFLDIDGFSSTVTLEPNVMNEFYHTATVPDGFFDYWADRGVVEGATGWKGIMWDIINGDAPIFYLVAATPEKNGYDYQLIDGLQYQNTPSQTMPLTLPGDYPQGDYTFSGTVKDIHGCVSNAINIDMEFVQAAVADAGQDATITIDQTYVISDAVAYNYSGVSWGTSGSGTFNNNTSLNPEYTPGAGDAGQVTLSLYVNPLAPCQQQATSTMTLTVKVRPEVEITAPADEAVIYQWDYTIEGTASDADGTIDKVEVKVNNGSWVDATGTDTWTYDATFEQGLNTVKARSQDNEGYYSDVDEISVYVHLQVIPLSTTRYQMISTFLDPVDPDVDNIMSDVVDDLDVMQSKTEIYAPPPFNINTIGNWDTQTAYGLYMSLETEDEIVVGGDPLADNSLNLGAGVNYLPVLSDQLSPIDDIFTDPENDILYIFDFSTGLIYWPDGGLYFLTNLVPGRGYLSNFINPVTVDYPDYAGYKPVYMAVQQMETLCPWPLTKTGNVHVISIDRKAVVDIQDADFIGAFDGDGNCIGYADLSIDDSNIPMMLFGDNTWTDIKDGAAEGETINFVAYNSETGDQESITAVFDPDFANHDGTFATGGLSMISSFYKSSIGYAGTSELTPVKVFPNPAKGIVNIETGTVAKDAVVSFMNAEGLVVKKMDVTGGSARINISDLAPGVYFVKITIEGQGNVIQKLVIQ